MDCSSYYTVVPAPGGKFRACFATFRRRADGTWGVRAHHGVRRTGRRLTNIYTTHPAAMAAAQRMAAAAGLRAYPQGTPAHKVRWA